MKKKTIKDILYNNPINIKDVNSFIVAYIKEFKDIDLDSTQLNGIHQLIKARVFSLYYAAKQAAIKTGLQPVELFDKNNNLIKTYVY